MPARYWVRIIWIDEEHHVVHVTDVISVRVNQIPRLEMMPLL